MQYLTVDPDMPQPYGKFIWSPDIGHATPFPNSTDADAIKKLVPDATEVIQLNGKWYVAKG